MKRIQKNFRDDLAYGQLRMKFNDREYLVFRERLEYCCSFFSKNNNNFMESFDFVNDDDNDIEKGVIRKINEIKDQKDKKDDEFFIYKDKDIKDEIFSAFVKCINGEEININESNSIGLLILSIEFGYMRLKEECEDYISKEHSILTGEIKKMLEEMIKEMIKKKKKKNKIRMKRVGIRNRERDFGEFEKVIAEYFNIAIIEENEMLKKLPIEVLNRIIHNSEFSIEKLNNEQKHLLIELIIYRLNKEGKCASILMNGISIKSFSNSDIRLIMKEKSFILSTMKVGEDEIKEMVDHEGKLEEMKNEIEQLKEEMIEIRRKFEKEKTELEREKNEKKKKKIDKKLKKKIIKKDLENLKLKIENIEKELEEQKMTELPYSNGIGIMEYIKGNPKRFGSVNIKGSSSNSYYQQVLPNIIKRDYTGECWQSEDKIGTSLEIEFSNNTGILIDHYLIHSHEYNYGNDECHLRNWRIEGRKKNGDWITIDDRRKNCDLNDNNLENIFKISKRQTESVSSIRLTMTGRNSDKNAKDHSIFIRNIEFFGCIVK